MNHTADLDYKRYFRLIEKRRYQFVAVALAIMTAVVAVSYILPEKYEARCTVFIEKSVISEMVKGIAITPSLDEKLKVLAYTMKSRKLLLNVFNELGFDFNTLSSGQQEKMLRSFQERTVIRLKDKEGLFIISFSDKDPRIARDFVNALVRRYIEENVVAKREESYVATNFLAEQIMTVKSKLEEAEARVNDFRRANSNLLAHNEGMVLAEMTDAQQRLDELAIKRRQLESSLNIVMRNDPAKSKLAALRSRKQELSLMYTENHPEIVEINNEISVVSERAAAGTSQGRGDDAPSLEAEKIRLELSSLRELETRYRRTIAVKQSQLRGIPAARTGLDELEREKNSQKHLYEQLMARHGQSEVSKQVEVQDKATTLRIVDPAILPTQPFSPQRVKIILTGIFGGVLASFGLVLLQDRLDKSIRTVDAIRSLGVQVLAVVPTIDDPEVLLAQRRRDVWFYGLSSACFILVLLTVPLELMRSLSIDMFGAAGLKAHVNSVKAK